MADDGIEGMSDLLARLGALESRLGAEGTENRGLLRAGVAALKAASDRIDAGGPGWPPNKSHTPLLHRTGRLLASFSIGNADNIDLLTGNEIEVGTNVEYARYLQEGTRFMPARPFLFIDEQLAETIAEIFGTWVWEGQET